MTLTAPAAAPAVDERLSPVGPIVKMLQRPAR